MQLLLENLVIAIHAVWINKIRSFLTILGVVIGVFAVIIIVAMISGLKEEIVKMVTSLGADVIDIVPVKTEGSTGFGAGMALNSFSEKEAREFEEKTQGWLKAGSPLYEMAGTFSYHNQEVRGFIVGVRADYFKMRNRYALAGVLFNDNDDKRQARVVVLGLRAADDLFGTFQNAIGKTIKVNGKELKVIGVLEKEELGFGSIDINQAVYLPFTTTRRLFPEARITEIFVQVASADEVSVTKLRLESVLKEMRPDGEYTIFTQKTILELVDQITGLITTALAGLASISLIVGGIGIMNIMLVSVAERTREIGIRKAIGATNQNILVQFLIEAIVLCLLGGLIGILIAAGVSLAITHYAKFPTLISWQTVAGAFFFSVLIGVTFGIIPAMRAAQKDPIEALHYE